MWNSFADFINMGGYAFYVWSSYGVTVLFIVVEILLVMRKKKSLIKRIARAARSS